MTRPLIVLSASLACALSLRAQVTANRPAGRPASSPVVAVDRVIAIAGDHPILWSEVIEEYNTRRAQNTIQIPTDTVEHRKLVESIIDELIDSELLIQKAVLEKVEEIGRAHV